MRARDACSGTADEGRPERTPGITRPDGPSLLQRAAAPVVASPLGSAEVRSLRITAHETQPVPDLTDDAGATVAAALAHRRARPLPKSDVAKAGGSDVSPTPP